MSPTKQKVYLEHLLNWVDIKSKLEDLDETLKEYLETTKGDNDVILDVDFPDKLREIPSDSLIIYVKKAQIFKVYNALGMEDFNLDEFTHYRKPEHGPVYEVVRDSHPQKLMIVITDDVKDERLRNIKQHIVDFTDCNPEFSKINISDLKVFSNDNNTEFVVSSVKLQNISERDLFIESFTSYMRNINSDIANKIQLRPPYNMKGARLYKIPSLKTPLEITNGGTMLDQLITTTHAPVVINLTINNNNNVGNVNNVNYGNVTISESKTPPKKTLKTYCKYIYDTKPSWYIEGAFVNLSTLVESYREYFGILTVSQ